jgi:hypothetical protein
MNFLGKVGTGIPEFVSRIPLKRTEDFGEFSGFSFAPKLNRIAALDSGNNFIRIFDLDSKKKKNFSPFIFFFPLQCD